MLPEEMVKSASVNSCFWIHYIRSCWLHTFDNLVIIFSLLLCWYPCCTSPCNTYRCLLWIKYTVAAHFKSLKWLYAWKKAMSRSFSLIISGCNTERQCGNLGDVELAIEYHMWWAVCLAIDVSVQMQFMSMQFQIISSNWFANSRSLDIASSAIRQVLIESAKKRKSCSSWLLTWHCALHKLSNVVLQTFCWSSL